MYQVGLTDVQKLWPLESSRAGSSQRKPCEHLGTYPKLQERWAEYTLKEKARRYRELTYSTLFFRTVSVVVLRFSSVTFFLFFSFFSSVLWLTAHAVGELTVPVGDDGQLMSGGSPVLWLSTYAVQLTVPIAYRRRRPADVRRLARPMA